MVEPLLYAIRIGSLSQVQRAVRNGADPNGTDRHGRTPLYYAMYHNRVDVTEWLMNPIVDSMDPAPTQMRLPRADPFGHRCNQYGTVFHMAAHYGRLEILQCLMRSARSSVGLKNEEDETDDDGDNLSDNLSESLADIKTSIECLHRPLCDPLNIRDKRGNTPLHIAALKGHSSVVSWLVQQRGIDIESKNKSDQTALHHAVERCHAEIVVILRKAGANCNAKWVKGWTAAHTTAARHSGRVEMLEALTCTLPVEPTATSASLVAQSVDIIASGSDININASGLMNINAQDDHGRTPLHLAADRGYLEMVQWLVRHGADVWATNEAGGTALHRATQNFHLDLVIYLATEMKSRPRPV